MAQTITRAKIAPFTREEWAALKRCGRAIHSWSEELCNGTIQETEKGIYHRFYNDRYGSPTIQGGRIADRSERAIERARTIAGKHGLSVYEQTDPRGCALHIYNAADLKGRDIDSCYSMIGHPVM